MSQNDYEGLCEKLENILKCPICQEVAVTPILTPCKHLFCTPCLMNHLASKERTPECPSCRRVINFTRIMTVPILTDLSDLVRKPNNASSPPAPPKHASQYYIPEVVSQATSPTDPHISQPLPYLFYEGQNPVFCETCITLLATYSDPSSVELTCPNSQCMVSMELVRRTGLINAPIDPFSSHNFGLPDLSDPIYEAFLNTFDQPNMGLDVGGDFTSLRQEPALVAAHDLRRETHTTQTTGKRKTISRRPYKKGGVAGPPGDMWYTLGDPSRGNRSSYCPRNKPCYDCECFIAAAEGENKDWKEGCGHRPVHTRRKAAAGPKRKKIST